VTKEAGPEGNNPHLLLLLSSPPLTIMSTPGDHSDAMMEDAPPSNQLLFPSSSPVKSVTSSARRQQLRGEKSRSRNVPVDECLLKFPLSPPSDGQSTPLHFPSSSSPSRTPTNRNLTSGMASRRGLPSSALQSEDGDGQPLFFPTRCAKLSARENYPRAYSSQLLLAARSTPLLEGLLLSPPEASSGPRSNHTSLHLLLPVARLTRVATPAVTLACRKLPPQQTPTARNVRLTRSCGEQRSGPLKP
jgi:hypothetical protein